DLRIALFDVLVESKSILEAGAPASLHEHAQLEVGIGFLADELADLGGGRIRENEAWRSVHFSVHTGSVGALRSRSRCFSRVAHRDPEITRGYRRRGRNRCEARAPGARRQACAARE